MVLVAQPPAVVNNTFENPLTVKDDPYNAVGDGTTDETAAFQAAMAAQTEVVVPEGTYRFNGHLTIPAGVKLRMQPGAKLLPRAGKRIVIIGEIDAGLQQCFAAGESTTINITSVSNAAPNVVTTATNHGLATGDYVRVRDVSDAPAANGDYVITVLSPTTFSLTNSQASGAGTGGTVTAEGFVQFSQASRQSSSIAGLGGGFATPLLFPGAETRLYPEWFGAVMGNSISNAVGNSDAIRRLQMSVSSFGATMFITGVMVIDRQITYPKEWIPTGSYAFRSKPFNIDGIFGVSHIVKVESSDDGIGEPAVRVDDVYQAHLPTETCSLGLTNVFIISKANGVEMYSGGKQLILRDVVIAHCEGEWGLYVVDVSGFTIDRVYCYRNNQNGAYFTLSFLVDAALSCRENGLTGLVIDGCASWTGFLYTEGNGEWGGDFIDFHRFDCLYWQEANWRNTPGAIGLSNVQSRMRRCSGILHGKHAGSWNTGWELDSLSRSGVIMEGDDGMRGDYYRSSISSDYAGMVLTPVTQYSLPIRKGGVKQGHWALNTSAFPTGIRPSVSYDENEGYLGLGRLKINVPAGAYDAANKPNPGTSGWLEYNAWGSGRLSGPLGQLSMAVGDTIIVSATIRLDTAAQTYFRSFNEGGIGALPIRMALTNGPFADTQTRNCYMPNRAVERFTMRAIAGQSGSGARLFFYINPTEVEGPSVEHNIYIEDVQILYAPVDEYNTALAVPQLPNWDNNYHPLAAKTFDPGYYITAPRVFIEGNIARPVRINDKTLWFASAVPDLIAEVGTFVHNSDPRSNGILGWVLGNRVVMKVNNASNYASGVTTFTVVSSAGVAVGDKIAIQVSGLGGDTGPYYNGTTHLHWTTVAAVPSGTSIQVAGSWPANTVLGGGTPAVNEMWAMRWTPVRLAGVESYTTVNLPSVSGYQVGNYVWDSTLDRPAFRTAAGTWYSPA